MADDDMRGMVDQFPVPEFDTTPFTQPPALEAATVAVVTTAGLIRRGEQLWGAGDDGFQTFTRDERDVIAAHESTNFDRTGIAADLNVVFPIDRLTEMTREGRIGDVAPRHLSFTGPIPELTTLRIDTGPAAAKLLVEDGVDIVLLTPVCPLCTRVVGTLAHVFEAAGLATVTLSLVRGQIERTHPPRALHCEFPLGRPLGRPGDAAFQHRVLDEAFALLRTTEVPVLVDFPDTITDEGDQPLVCPLPPRLDSSLPAAVDEARALRPAWERQRAQTGATQVGRVVDGDGVPDAVAAFVRIAEGTHWSAADLPGDPATVAMDIRAYYEEAALALSDHVPAARQAESWLYRSTAVGAVLKAAAATMAAADPPYERTLYLVPMSQQA